MDKLQKYINSLSVPDQHDFCRRIGTTIGYLRKAFSACGRLGESLCIDIERETGGAVRCEDMRPDVDWGYLRGTAPAPKAEKVA
ncbi:MAG: helix-turn-helix domain-containing protein [Betaproteobacteria bacterium]|nr:helix-turn-helix domain-containing protein [Betaproteobacteria bacterium]